MDKQMGGGPEFNPADEDKFAVYVQEIRELQAEIQRLKAGDFTEEEFQNLCHKFQDADVNRFCDGCEGYHIKLFGRSPITDLREDVAIGARLIEVMREHAQELGIKWQGDQEYLVTVRNRLKNHGSHP